MIDRMRMPGTGAEFVAALHRQLTVPLSGARGTDRGFPQLLLTSYAPKPGVSPHLVNLWSVDDPAAEARVVGGIAGPSGNPDRDWRLFRDAIEAPEALDAQGYAALLDEVDRMVRAHVLSRPDQFQPLS